MNIKAKRPAVRILRFLKILPALAGLVGLSTNLSLGAETPSIDSDSTSWIRYELQGVSVDIPRVSLQRMEATKPTISPEARTLLDQVQSAYKNIKSVDINGDFSVSVKTTNETRRMSQPFTSSYEQPNKFRHQMKPDVLVGCDGKSGYVFDQKENAYLRFNFPAAKQSAQKLPMGLLSTLLLQNPSLLFALTDTPVEDLLRSFGAVSRLPDGTINGVQYPVLQFGGDTDSNRVRMFIDPKSHLVRRFVLDLKSGDAGSREVASAHDAAVTIDYTGIDTKDSGFAPEHFAWAPPPGATDVLESAGADNSSKDRDKDKDIEKESNGSKKF